MHAGNFLENAYIFFFLQLGFTALHFASMSGNAEIVKLLIAAGLNVNSQHPVSYYCTYPC